MDDRFRFYLNQQSNAESNIETAFKLIVVQIVVLAAIEGLDRQSWWVFAVIAVGSVGALCVPFLQYAAGLGLAAGLAWHCAGWASSLGGGGNIVVPALVLAVAGLSNIYAVHSAVILDKARAQPSPGESLR